MTPFLTIATPLCLVASCRPGNMFAGARTQVVPDHETARENSAHIFNAINSAGRQFGSAMHHNGLSFFPTVMPKGTLLYHGAQSTKCPSGPEWLSLEVEHAEAFAFSLKSESKNMIQHHNHKVANIEEQRPLSPITAHSKDNSAYYRGNLHTYRASRDLNLLYIDGMSAAKNVIGTLDSQDLILRENITSGARDPLMEEIARAGDICSLLTELGYDGFMRMETGFEVVYCDFIMGLDLVMQVRTALREGTPQVVSLDPFQLARAVSERYDGLGNGVKFDFSSMVSGYFFPINITNPDPNRHYLPRLISADPSNLKDIKMYLKDAVVKPRKFSVNWQVVTDMIVTRYAQRLALLASPDQPFNKIIKELEIATRTYTSFPALPEDITTPLATKVMDSLQACKQHYLLPTYLDRESWSPQDHLIHTAIQGVLSDICDTLFAARCIFETYVGYQCNSTSQTTNGMTKASKLKASQKLFRGLKERLDWAAWRKPQLCAVDEVLFTIMWPLGNEEDYWNPGCRTYDQVNIERRSYWKRTAEHH